MTTYRRPTEAERQSTLRATSALAERLRAEGWPVTIAELLRSQWKLQVRLAFGETGPSGGGEE